MKKTSIMIFIHSLATCILSISGILSGEYYTFGYNSISNNFYYVQLAVGILLLISSYLVSKRKTNLYKMIIGLFSFLSIFSLISIALVIFKTENFASTLPFLFFSIIIMIYYYYVIRSLYRYGSNGQSSAEDNVWNVKV